MTTLFYLGVIFILGAFVEWLSPKIHLSKIVGYMLVGLILAPSTFSLVPKSFVDDVHILIDVSLSLIALLIGSRLKYSDTKGMTTQIFIITFSQAIATFIIVAVGLYAFSSYLFVSLQAPFAVAVLLAAIASATAPAAILAVVNELKVKGKFSTILLSVVALDDALALMLFAVALSVSQSLLSSGGMDFSAAIDSLLSVSESVLLGVLIGLITIWLEKLFSHHKGMQTIATLGMVFIAYSLSIQYGYEPLLTTLIMGATLSNLSTNFDLVQNEIDNHISEIVFMLFFIVSAMHLDLAALGTLPLAIIAYVLLRLIGKVFGSYIGAKVSHADENTQHYLGLALLPQAGVAIGLALSLQDHVSFASFAPMLLNLIMATTIIHEFIGPIMTYFALKRTIKKDN